MMGFTLTGNPPLACWPWCSLHMARALSPARDRLGPSTCNTHVLRYRGYDLCEANPPGKHHFLHPPA